MQNRIRQVQGPMYPNRGVWPPKTYQYLDLPERCFKSKRPPALNCKPVITENTIRVQGAGTPGGPWNPKLNELGITSKNYQQRADKVAADQSIKEELTQQVTASHVGERMAAVKREKNYQPILQGIQSLGIATTAATIYKPEQIAGLFKDAVLSIPKGDLAKQAPIVIKQLAQNIADSVRNGTLTPDDMRKAMVAIESDPALKEVIHPSPDVIGIVPPPITDEQRATTDELDMIYGTIFSSVFQSPDASDEGLYQQFVNSFNALDLVEQLPNLYKQILDTTPGYEIAKDIIIGTMFDVVDRLDVEYDTISESDRVSYAFKDFIARVIDEHIDKTVRVLPEAHEIDLNIEPILDAPQEDDNPFIEHLPEVPPEEINVPTEPPPNELEPTIEPATTIDAIRGIFARPLHNLFSQEYADRQEIVDVADRLPGQIEGDEDSLARLIELFGDLEKEEGSEWWRSVETTVNTIIDLLYERSENPMRAEIHDVARQEMINYLDRTIIPNEGVLPEEAAHPAALQAAEELAPPAEPIAVPEEHIAPVEQVAAEVPVPEEATHAAALQAAEELASPAEVAPIEQPVEQVHEEPLYLVRSDEPHGIEFAEGFHDLIVLKSLEPQLDTLLFDVHRKMKTYSGQGQLRSVDLINGHLTQNDEFEPVEPTAAEAGRLSVNLPEQVYDLWQDLEKSDGAWGATQFGSLENFRESEELKWLRGKTKKLADWLRDTIHAEKTPGVVQIYRAAGLSGFGRRNMKRPTPAIRRVIHRERSPPKVRSRATHRKPRGGAFTLPTIQQLTSVTPADLKKATRNIGHAIVRSAQAPINRQSTTANLRKSLGLGKKTVHTGGFYNHAVSQLDTMLGHGKITEQKYRTIMRKLQSEQ
jgi:hypothetical protein